MFWKWIMAKVVEWAVTNLTEEVIKEWVESLKQKVIPWLRTKAYELIAELRAKAADTATPIDDVAVDAFEKLVNILLPDTPEIL